MSKNSAKKFVSRCYWPGLALGLVLVGVYVLGQPLFESPDTQQPAEIAPVEIILPPDAPYTARKPLRLMNVSAARLEHKQFPQEFVVVKGLDPQTVEQVFADQFDPAAYKPMAEGLLSMKDPLHPVSLDIRELKTLENSIAPLEGGKKLQTRRMRVTFQLSSEDRPRAYEGSVSRVVDAEGQASEPLVYVSFARDSEYRAMAVPAFLQTVRAH